MKEVKVAFREQAKGVIAEASVKYLVEDDFNNNKSLEESEALMTEALKKSAVMSMRKG